MFSKWWGLFSKAASMLSSLGPVPTFSPRVRHPLTWLPRLGLCWSVPSAAMCWDHERATAVNWPSTARVPRPRLARMELILAMK